MRIFLMIVPVSLKTVILFFFLVAWRPLAAQYEEEHFTRYTVKEGLSENYIKAIQQDDWGYLWVATEIGLNRFDGHTFTSFQQGNAPLKLASSLMVDLKRMGKHQLGILSRGGFQLLNTRDYSVQNYFIPDTTPLTAYSNHTWDAVKTDKGSIALTTPTGFYIFDTTGQLQYRHDAYALNDIGQKRIRYGRFFYHVAEREYIITTEDTGVAHYNEETKIYREIPGAENSWNTFRRSPITLSNGKDNIHSLGKNRFVYILVNQDSIALYDHTTKKTTWSPLPFRAKLETDWSGRILVLNDTSFALTSSNTGFFLFHIDPTTNVITCSPKKFFTSYKVNCLFLDKEARLWIGTTAGLLKQKLNKPVVKIHTHAALPFDYSTVGYKAAFRYKDKLFLGRYSRYAGLFILDTQTMQPIRHLEFFGQDNMWNEVLSIQMYHPDTLWLGTNAGILWLDTKSLRYGIVETGQPPVNAVFLVNLSPANKDGYAWFCYMLNGLVGRYHISSRRFDFFTSKTVPALPFDKVKSIAYDSYGDVWIGGHALARWNNRSGVFDTLIKVYGGVKKFNDDILAMVADNNGSLWIHNAENGLLEYIIKEKRFVSYTMQDGLPTMVLNNFSPVVNDSLWIGSNKYLTLFNTRTKKAVTYDQGDGYTGNAPTTRYIHHDPQLSRFYLSGKDELLVFPSQENSQSPTSELLTREITVNNKRSVYFPATGLQFRHHENNIILHFDVVDFEAGSSYQVAYRFNTDEEWTHLGAQRSINLNGLSPGHYVIHLQARGKAGILQSKSFDFTILPPFWKTPLFFISAGLLLLALGYLLYRYRIRHIRQKANIDKMLAQTEMKALHAQMNPHFIFNSLNSISEMILNNDNKDASHYLSKFAHLIRITLDQSGKTFVSLRNTMEYLQRYTEMEQVRNSHFSFTMEAASDLDPDEIQLPPMLIQPFIENAIWHGITETRKNIAIKVNFKKESEQLVCVIDDNGIGINESLAANQSTGTRHHPVGISNIRNRIHLLNEKHKLACSLTIQDKSELTGNQSGTLVTLRLPLEIKADE